LPFQIDFIFHNAHIITMDPALPRVEAMAVTNGRIIALGSDEELKPLFEMAKEIIDVNGDTVLPGFIDTHTHLAGLGRRLLHLDLGDTKSAEEAIRLVGEQVKKSPSGKLVLGYNWDESKWTTSRYITKEDLDPIAPDNPVVLIRVCGHLASTNSAALKQIDIDATNPGVDKNNDTGEPTGVLRDIPIDTRKLETEEEDLSQSIIAACRFANSVGVTSVHENLYLLQLPILAAFIKVRQNQQLSVRVYANLETGLLDKLAGLGLPTGLGDEYFRLGGVKAFIDGSFGAQTAALSQPYQDHPESDGLLLFDEEDYRFLLKTANQYRLQVSTHAIGDRGIDMVLRSHEQVSKAKLVKELRHNIIHAEFLTQPLIDRVKKLDMLLLQQPNFVHRWGLPGEMYDSRLGPERAQQLNNFRKILDEGIKIAFGSDCMPMDPIYGIYSAVTHPNPAIRITVEEAIRLYTADAAYASFEEQDKGTLTLGKLADFIRLSADPFTLKPETLRDLKVLETYVGGRQVFSSL
jgi:predicted amidohydrolase YtcJ